LFNQDKNIEICNNFKKRSNKTLTDITIILTFVLIFKSINYFTMIAIVNIAGQQFKVTEGQELFVHQLEASAGSSVSFDQVLMIDNSGSVQVGTPVISNATVNATVIGNQKGDKVIVFKKKRRKGFQKKNGHRQCFTKIKIESISA
jgi:large subunit ribosomal protein L21